MSQKNEWKNDLISFISHECYYGDFKVLQADIYRNTREFQASRPSKEEPNRFEKKTTNLNLSFERVPPWGP